MSGGCSASLEVIPRRAPKGAYPLSGIADRQFIGVLLPGSLAPLLPFGLSSPLVQLA